MTISNARASRNRAYVNGLSPAVLPAPYAYSNDSFGFLGQCLWDWRAMT